MLTLNQTAGKDTNAIWVIRINLDSNGYLYFSDTNDKITLSGIDFDGKVIFKDSFSDIEKIMDVAQGGSIGQVGNFSFSLARYTNYTGVSNFFNDFYPATSKPLLTSKTIEVGIVWSGATSLSEITWFAQYYIEDYSFQTNKMDLVCIEYDELQGKDLPPFTLQDKFDDGISYYPTIKEELLGKPIPIVYGDFTYRNLEYELFNFAPAVAISNGNSYKIACHLCHTVESNSYLYEYLDPVETVMELSVATPIASNTRAGHYITLSGRKEKIYGRLRIMPRGYVSGGSNYENAIDKDSTSYATLAVDSTMKWQLNAKLSNAEFGLFNGVRADSNFIILWDSDGGNVDFQIKYWHLEFGGYSSLVASGSRNGTAFADTYSFGDGNYDYGANPKKRNDTADWTPDELEKLEFHILNLATSSAAMKIKHIYFDFKNLTKYEVQRKPTFREISSGERNKRDLLFGQRPQITNNIEDNIFAYVKGLQFDYWVN